MTTKRTQQLNNRPSDWRAMPGAYPRAQSPREVIAGNRLAKLPYDLQAKIACHLADQPEALNCLLRAFPKFADSVYLADLRTAVGSLVGPLVSARLPLCSRAKLKRLQRQHYKINEQVIRSLQSRNGKIDVNCDSQAASAMYFCGFANTANKLLFARVVRLDPPQQNNTIDHCCSMNFLKENQVEYFSRSKNHIGQNAERRLGVCPKADPRLLPAIEHLRQGWVEQEDLEAVKHQIVFSYTYKFAVAPSFGHWEKPQAIYDLRPTPPQKIDFFGQDEGLLNCVFSPTGSKLLVHRVSTTWSFQPYLIDLTDPLLRPCSLLSLQMSRLFTSDLFALPRLESGWYFRAHFSDDACRLITRQTYDSNWGEFAVVGVSNYAFAETARKEQVAQIWDVSGASPILLRTLSDYLFGEFSPNSRFFAYRSAQGNISVVST